MLVHVLAKSGEAAKSGPIGLAVILILCIVCYFLFKSMSKHMRKVREDFPGQQSAVGTPAKRLPAATPAEPTVDTSSETPPADAPSGQPSPERPAE
jgi:hypothetical protein